MNMQVPPGYTIWMATQNGDDEQLVDVPALPNAQCETPCS